ncbi:MAG: TrbC/VirB2 family protein [Firmicutes bacterium]|nr:TrbC/VirB2 family protein [Bacillota bacterium]
MQLEQSILRRLVKMKNTNKPIFMKKPKKQRYSLYIIAAVILALCWSDAAFASGGTSDPIAVVNNLSDFMFSLVRAVGMIMIGLGIVQVGLSLKGHDPSQRANGILTVAGGIIITFAKEIVNMIAG